MGELIRYCPAFRAELAKLSLWLIAAPVKAAKAQVAVEFIYEEIVCQCGAPKRILSDRGSHFNNSLIRELLATLGVRHQLTSAYHPPNKWDD